YWGSLHTLGMIIGTFKGLVNKEKNDYISSRVPYMLISGILVSLLSAATAGLFIW
ncbi:NupC/NupG family nucleoside CNT transporter, partial [Leuconostoc falkenbergense]|nr:NupC/NupG family nucleoside CNT transporter [Leuconostoc falkenbergense]